MSQFDPFSPEFGGAVVDGGATTTTTKSSPAEPLPLDLLTPSMSTTTGAGVDLLSMDPFAPKQQSSGLATFETKGAYGGVTWTSPLEKKYATGRPKEDDLLSVLATSVTVPPPLPQKSTTTGLSCLASPPPLPNSSLDSSTTMMGGNTGTGFSTPPPLPTGTSQALTTTTTTQVDPEEDEEFLQAQQAAMEAKAMMEKLALQQKKKEEEGFLGLGHLIPKPPNFFAPTDATTNKTATASNPWFQSASPTRDTGTPPWHPSLQESGQHAAVSDFGIPPTTVANSSSTSSSSGTGAAIMGASVVGGVAGLMLVGPLVGIVAAGGAAYAAGTKEGPVGSILRGTGSLAASAGGAAKRFDDEHQILAKSVKGIASGVGWIVKTVNGNTPDH